ncbi:MAG: UbiA family prenyltransferase [Pirellula sp.]
MHPKLKAWAQLVRVPNTLTACADVLAGFSIAAGDWLRYQGYWPGLMALCIGSICLYWAGMVLNDVNDVEADRSNRRLGPLVDQRISLPLANRVGWGLLLMGVALALVAALLVPDESSVDSPNTVNQRSMVVCVGVFLASAIVAYDSRLKATWIGPSLMGLCRGLNLLMGVMLGACLTWPDNSDWRSIAVVFAGHSLFVAGLTLAARRESAIGQSRTRLILGWGTSVAGVIAIAFASLLVQEAYLRCDPGTTFPVLVGLLACPWLRRAYNSIVQPGSGTLVLAIKQAIMSIIFFDAALALQFAGNLPGLVVCGLALPTLALGRFFRMT